jgi:hypothetical protein
VEKHRRIEISTFRRRIMIVSAASPAVDPGVTSVLIRDTSSQEELEPGSDEARRLLADAIRILENELGRQAKNFQVE